MIKNRSFGLLWIVWSVLLGCLIARMIWIGSDKKHLLLLGYGYIKYLVVLAILGYLMKWKKTGGHAKLAITILSYELLTVFLSPKCYSELNALFMLGTMWVVGLLIGIIFARGTKTERPFLMSVAGIFYAYLFCPITIYFHQVLQFSDVLTISIPICPGW